MGVWGMGVEVEGGVQEEVTGVEYRGCCLDDNRWSDCHILCMGP